MRAGVILCGGTSTRFGETDKASRLLAGKPLVRHVADRLFPVIDEVVVSCRREQTDTLEDALVGYDRPVRFAYDERADAGPLHGIGRALSETDATYVVVVACDMPFVDPSFVRHLFETAEERDGAIPRTDDGWYQPLLAVYRSPAVLTAIRRASRMGVDRPIEAVQSLDYVVVADDDLESVTDDWTFFNVNTPEDLERARNRLRSVSPSEKP
ncbi:MAG: molybdenum cofactor guanylyltransferase [Halodesulfurarchaeum sp.]